MGGGSDLPPTPDLSSGSGPEVPTWGLGSTWDPVTPPPPDAKSWYKGWGGGGGRNAVAHDRRPCRGHFGGICSAATAHAAVNSRAATHLRSPCPWPAPAMFSPPRRHRSCG